MVPYGAMDRGNTWLRQCRVDGRQQAITCTKIDFSMWGSVAPTWEQFHN